MIQILIYIPLFDFDLKLYCIPGLAFDHRIFSRLNLEELKPVYLDWIEPDKQESFHEYALRFSEQIDQGADVVLIGHSMGGMLAQEIASIIPVKQIILISSLRKRSENPIYFKLVYPLRLHLLAFRRAITLSLPIWGSFHDYVSRKEKELLEDMIMGYSRNYLQWALKQLSLWKAPELTGTTKIIRLHGDKDRTLPFRKIKSTDYLIKDGGHFMVYRKSPEISEIIHRELNMN